MVDSYKHKGMRRGLVLELKEKGIIDPKILTAINTIPRHFFFDSALEQHAYQDKAFPIGEGQTISQPYTVARQTSLLKLKTGMKVLEIGTGSGYQACVLIALGAKLYSIEYVRKLHLQAKKRLFKMGFEALFFCGDGTKGLANHAPFDRIIVTAGAPQIPDSLVAQLKPEGILVIPVGDEKTQMMLRITKAKDGKLTIEEFDNFRFVPLIGEEGW